MSEDLRETFHVIGFPSGSFDETEKLQLRDRTSESRSVNFLLRKIDTI